MFIGDPQVRISPFEPRAHVRRSKKQDSSGEQRCYEVPCAGASTQNRLATIMGWTIQDRQLLTPNEWSAM
jgi:hypothetical protein